MYGTLRSLLTSALIPGLVLWTPGTSVVLSQEPEATGPTPLAIERVAGIDRGEFEAMRIDIDSWENPRVAEIAGGLLDAAGTDPRVAYGIAQDAQIIHNATTNAREMVEQAQTAAPQLQQALIEQGVSTEVATQLNEALADAQTALAAGTIDTAGGELEALRNVVTDVRTQLGEQEFNALLGAPEEAGLPTETHEAIKNLFELTEPNVQDLDVVDHQIAMTLAEQVSTAVAEGVSPAVIVPVCSRLGIDPNVVLTESVELAVEQVAETEGERGLVVVEFVPTEDQRREARRALTEYLSNPALTPEARQQALDAYRAWEFGEPPPVVVPPHEDPTTVQQATEQFEQWKAEHPDLTPEQLAVLEEGFREWRETGFSSNQQAIGEITGWRVLGDMGMADVPWEVPWTNEQGPTGPPVISPGSLTPDQIARAQEQFQAFLGQNTGMSETARAELEKGFRDWLAGKPGAVFGPGSETTGHLAEVFRDIFEQEHRLYQVFDGRMPADVAARAHMDMNREFMYRTALASGDTTMADRIAAEAAMRNVRPDWVDAATWERMGITFQETPGGGVVAMPPTDRGWGELMGGPGFMRGGPGPGGEMMPPGTVTASQLEALGLNPEQIAGIGDGSRSTYGPHGFVTREEMRTLGLTDQQIYQVEAAAGYASGGGYGGAPITSGVGADGLAVFHGDIGNMHQLGQGVHVDEQGRVVRGMGSDVEVLGTWEGTYGAGPATRMPDGSPETWTEAQQREFGWNPETGFAYDTARGTYPGGGYAGPGTFGGEGYSETQMRVMAELANSGTWAAGPGYYGGGGGYYVGGDPASYGINPATGGYEPGFGGGTAYTGGGWDSTSTSYTSSGGYTSGGYTGGWTTESSAAYTTQTYGGTSYTGGSYTSGDPYAAAQQAAYTAQEYNTQERYWHCHPDHDHNNDGQTEEHCELTQTQ